MPFGAGSALGGVLAVAVLLRDRAVDGGRTSGKARARPTGDDRHLRDMAEPQDFDDLRLRIRQKDGTRLLTKER